MNDGRKVRIHLCPEFFPGEQTLQILAVLGSCGFITAVSRQPSFDNARYASQPFSPP